MTLENSGTIANNGTLTIKQGGTLTGGTVTGAAVIYEVTGVMLNKTSTTLTVGGTETLTATVLPEGAGNRAVTWSSDHTTVAAVDANGRVTAVAKGTATITVTTADGGHTAACTVTVRPRSSSGDSEPTYALSLDVGNGGTVKVDPRTPEAGEEVTLTVTPDEGYEAEQVSVTDRDGDPVDVTEHRDGTYTFEQPRGRVTIADTFRQVSRGMPFADMPESYWAYDAIQYVYGEGLMAGTSGSAFSPESTTTREQLAVMLHRCAQHQGYDVSIGEDTNILSYADAFDVSRYAVSALQRACGAGIISGTGDGSTLTPQARPPARRRRRCGCGSVNRIIDQASAMPDRRNCGERMSRHPKTGRGLRDKSANLAGLETSGKGIP